MEGDLILQYVNWGVLYVSSEWMIRLATLVYVPQQRSAAAARTWLLLIFLLPWPGLALYAIFGRIRVPQARIGQQLLASQRILTAQLRERPSHCCEAELPEYLAHIPGLAARLGDFDLSAGNAVELLPAYNVSIDRLIADIDEARLHVHLLTYILAPDETGRRVTEALIRASKRGVRCRIMLDAVGSHAGLRQLAPALRRAGSEVIAVLKVGFFRHNVARFDLRNHRKLAVIDGRIGYVGSQNLIDPRAVPGFTNIELVARVMGPAVAQFQAVLLADYFMETPGKFDFEPLFPDVPAAGTSVVQLLPSGPGYRRENAEELFVALLYSARQSVVITTPYFVPDESFLRALRSAACRGVVVRLIVSLHANQPFTQLAQRSYYDDLLVAGVHIHLYRPHFLHAKSLTVDDSISVLGSANIDVRSFALNAEVSFIVYDREISAQLRALQDGHLADCDVLELTAWRQRPLRQRVAQNLARLADTLL